jgi:hypothetical protein
MCSTDDQKRSCRAHARTRTHAHSRKHTPSLETSTLKHTHTYTVTILHAYTHTPALRTRTQADKHERNVRASLHACHNALLRVFVLVFSVRHLLHHGELQLQAHQLSTSMCSSLRFLFLPLDHLLETIAFLFQGRDKAHIHMCSNDDQKRAW